MAEANLTLLENCTLQRDAAETRQDVHEFYQNFNVFDRDGKLVENTLELEVPMDIMKRAALLAREPDEPDLVEEITTSEKAALRREKNTGFRDFTWGLKAIIVLTSLAGVTQGWTQTSINTGGLGWRTEFGLKFSLDDSNIRWNDTLMYGWVQSAPFLAGSIIGIAINDPLQYYLGGRRLALFGAGLVSLGSFIGSSYCRTTIELMIWRLILAIGIAAKASIAPILAAEASLDSHRGKILIGTWQFSDTIGIFLGFCFHLAIFPKWRATTAAPAIPTLLFLMLVYLAPDSPHPSIQRGGKKNYIKAFRNFRRIRETDLQACRDFWRARAQLQYETEIEHRRHGIIADSEPQWPRRELYQQEWKRTSWIRHMSNVVRLPYSSRACVTAAIPMIAQILTGVNVIAFYSTDIFNEGKTYSKRATLLGFAFGAANVIFTLPAFRYVDKKGRRWLLLGSLLGVTVSLFGLAFCFKANRETQESLRVGLVITFIIIFTFFYSVGCGPIPFTLSAEVFPLATRNVGMSIAVFLNFFLLGLLVLLVPALTYLFRGKGGNPDDGRTHLLCFFGGLSLVSFLFGFFYVRRTTSGLFEMASIFDRPTKGPAGHGRYQGTVQLPWLIKRYRPWKWRMNNDDRPDDFDGWSRARETELATMG